MNRKLLFIPLALFLALAAALFWQLMRNADGDDPTTLESALIGKPLPEFRLEALNTPAAISAGVMVIGALVIIVNVISDILGAMANPLKHKEWYALR